MVCLTACQSTTNKIAGICQIKHSVSTFENTKTVEFTECWNAKSLSVWDTPTIMIGYKWNQSKPELIQMNLTYNSQVGGGAYTNFNGIDINIDGDIYEYETTSTTILSSSDYNSVSNTIYTSSRNAIVMPFSVFERMMGAENVRFRIYTSEGYEDQIFNIAENGMSKYAKYYLPKYLIDINQIK